MLADPMGARRRVGYFPEYAPFYPDLSVEQYLRFVGCLKQIARRRRGSAVADVLTSCGLEEVARRLIGKLSKGYRQRVGLAQALPGDPPVLILDEPTIGLDPERVGVLATPRAAGWRSPPCSTCATAAWACRQRSCSGRPGQT